VETLSLVKLSFLTKCRFFLEWLRVIAFYYKNIRFAITHIIFLLSYLFINPYRVSRCFMQRLGKEDVYTYGETPLTTLEVIAKSCQITTKDSVIELGCGRGLNLVWLNDFIGCQTWGVDFVPTFIKIARSILSVFRRPKILIEEKNYFDIDFSEATVVILLDPFLNEEELLKLRLKLEKLPKGARVFTSSFFFSDLDGFVVKEKVGLKFFWGKATGYLHLKRG
jgi:hypothetical protein